MPRSLARPLAIALCLVLISAPAHAQTQTQTDEPLSAISAGAALTLLATAVGFLLIPGLGLTFAGLVRRKNVLATFQQSFILLGLVSLAWVGVGYSLACSGDQLGGLIGGLEHAGWHGFGSGAALAGGQLPEMLLAWSGLLPATAAIAIVSGAIAERAKFSAYLAFGLFWLLLVYCPIAHWIWGGGWIDRRLGPLDLAGGLVVQVPAGVAACCAAWMMGRRRGIGQEDRLPHNLTLTAIGTSLVWVGWLGLGISRAGGNLPTAILAAVNLHLSAGAGLVAWSLVEWLHKGRVTIVGSCTGSIAGLAAASAACASVPPFSAILIGLLVPPLGYAAVVRRRLTVDDALDVSSIHGVCGALGVLAPILLARSDLTAQAGLAVGGLLEGESSLVLPQLGALGVVLVYSLVATLLILKAIDLTLGLRVSADDEDAGLDLSQHGGRGYILEAGEAFILRSRNALDVNAEEDEGPPTRWGRRS